MLLTAGGVAGRRTSSKFLVQALFWHCLCDWLINYFMIHMWVRFTHKLNCFIFSSKQSEDSHIKLGSSRHKQYNTVNRPPTPRTPKHRLSVDPNLQIPEILNSASKKDLLRRVCHKWAYGESRTDMSPLVYINERKMLHFFFLIADFTIIKIIL